MLTPEQHLNIENRIVEVLKTVYDPEIPVDIYNLGLIYRIDLHDDGGLDVDMTLTAPNCPAAQALAAAVQEIYGVEARPVGIGGGTVAALLRQFIR